MAGALAVLAALACVVPDPGSRSLLITHAVSTALSALFVAAGITRLPRADRRPYRMILSAVLAFGGGEVTYLFEASYHPDRYPGLADLFTIAGYLPLAVGVWSLDRQRRTKYGGLLDAGIVTVSTAVLLAVFLVLPQISVAGLSLGERIMHSIYPLLDVLLLFMTSRMLAGAGNRGPVIWCLVVAMSCGLLTDVVAGIGAVTGGSGLNRLMFVSWALFYVFLGLATAAAAHRPPEPPAQDDAASGLTLTRLVVLGVAAMAPTVILVLLSPAGRDLDIAYLGIGSIVLLALVVARIWDLLQVLRRQQEALERASRVDPLTGVANRRSWDSELARQMASALRDEQVLLVGLLDLDHFKAYNDTHGHQAGDDLLHAAAQAWALAAGPRGRIARWGGEEFTVALLCDDEQVGIEDLDRLRADVPFGQTCSMGVARWDGVAGPDELLRYADEALYEAKRAGRDRIAVSAGLRKTVRNMRI
ncbi:GGDEF domain-containing protein [Kineosporia succinea]|uniref:Diguanylate cyclase (GGDEF)-like protein n=1 Tax=Kineosporia succinea TaxID=84632 RepID=A0ABT9PCI7_9ACTN|nr:GGDEF domain-containing protein [Kineosporia succinea]MDP9830426.1 diguanylate cyclase (GGDEF)-like protein [Kineosporia succinea]